jgi:erythronate-4-phosphate dehydrogenase
MKAVIDDKIPYIREAASSLFDATLYLPGAGFTPRNIAGADVLIVRTRTRCNARLLENSSVKFIATATIGYDHLDTHFLQEAGIAWANCPGCNASSVGQYVRNCLFLLQDDGLLRLRGATVGIVGAGHVGTAVQAALQPLGCTVLLNDPPRQEREGTGFVSLEEIAERCDVVTFHTPLTFEGAHPTFHLAGPGFFRRLGHGAVIINAARGGVVDEEALLEALESGQVGHAIIDTWEKEPEISRILLQKACISTPHIAGYSADGKANATRMALQAVCKHFHWQPGFHIAPPPLPPELRPEGTPEHQALQLYNPRRDSDALKLHPEAFEALRGNYPLRREVWDYGQNTR